MECAVCPSYPGLRKKAAKVCLSLIYRKQVNTGKFSAARIATAEEGVECSTRLATVSRLPTPEASLWNAGLEIAEIIAAANGPFDGTAKVEATMLMGKRSVLGLSVAPRVNE